MVCKKILSTEFITKLIRILFWLLKSVHKNAQEAASIVIVNA
jgi:hypothetical protein